MDSNTRENRNTFNQYMLFHEEHFLDINVQVNQKAIDEDLAHVCQLQVVR